MVEQNRDLQDQNLLLYYSLLDYSYKVLINKSYVTRSDFDAVEKLTTKTIDEYLKYYYHFYKAVHNTMIASYMEAQDWLLWITEDRLHQLMISKYKTKRGRIIYVLFLLMG